MRTLILSAFLFCSVSVFAQSKDTVSTEQSNKNKNVTDTAKQAKLVSKNSLSNKKEPLYIIDNKEVSSDALKKMNPDRIESIQVLKDAAATALYGVKAANGVVIVTTKSKKKKSQ